MQKQAEAHNLQGFMDAKTVASTVADNINMLAQNGHGYYRCFSIPEQLFGFTDYDINFGDTDITDSSVWINYSDSTWSTQIISNDVTIINLTKAEYLRNCITNNNGQITIFYTTNQTTCDSICAIT